MTTDTAELRAREQDKICRLMAQGLSLNRVCKLRDMPSMTTVFRWLREDASFAQQYALARESQADTLADSIIDLADKVTPLTANADRVRIDALKWVASKLKPRRYGDRVELGLPVQPTTPASWETLDPAGRLEVARRVAFAIRQGAEIVARQRSAPLLIEGRAEVVEPVPVYVEIDNRPKHPDPIRVLDEHRQDLARVKEDTAHVTADERGRSGPGRPQAITGRSLTGWRKSGSAD